MCRPVALALWRDRPLESKIIASLDAPRPPATAQVVNAYDQVFDVHANVNRLKVKRLSWDAEALSTGCRRDTYQDRFVESAALLEFSSKFLWSSIIQLWLTWCERDAKRLGASAYMAMGAGNATHCFTVLLVLTWKYSVDPFGCYRILGLDPVAL